MMALTSPYDVLVPWCKLSEHSGQTDTERLADLEAKTVAVPDTTPVTYGTIAASTVTQTEYNVLRAVVAGACQQEAAIGGYLLQDMHQRMLSGAGIDPSNSKTLVTLEAFRPSFRTALGGDAAGDALVTKLTAMGQKMVSQAEVWGVTVTNGHLASARTLIEEGN